VASQHLTALQIIDDVIKNFALHDRMPQLLHHYTSIDAALAILESHDIWFCHAEYLNDSSEIRGAHSLIVQWISMVGYKSQVGRQQGFLDQVLSKFLTQARLFEAFVFCMSEAIIPQPPAPPKSQDVLDSWRAYGKNGKGVCLSYQSQNLLTISQGNSGTRLSRVIYEPPTQEKIVDFVIDKGYKTYNSANNPPDAIDATAAALIFLMPILKNKGFEQEHEWRFIFLPNIEDHTVSKRKFFIRDGLIVPYYTMLDADPNPDNIPPVAEIMLGPSSHQALNARSLEYRRGRATLRTSDIPYRS
jgi:hypothetical protein